MKSESSSDGLFDRERTMAEGGWVIMYRFPCWTETKKFELLENSISVTDFCKKVSSLHGISSDLDLTLKGVNGKEISKDIELKPGQSLVISAKKSYRMYLEPSSQRYSHLDSIESLGFLHIA